jgi:aminoglycoside phosphotransferase (APT) family kinase protein
VSEEQRLTRSYSERLGVLTGAQLQAALDRFGLGALRDAAPIPGGLFGQNVLVTSTRGEWVLRGCPHFDWQLPKERLVARLIHGRTSLAAPWPYLVEESPEIFGWAFALMPRLPGQAPPSAARGEQGRAVAEALGSGLARLHELRGEAPGEYDLAADAILPSRASHADRVSGRLRQWLAWCHEARDGCVGDADVAWVEAVLAARRAALDEPFEACWVHHDWKSNNVLCEAGGGGFRVTGVVDLMEGYFGDGEEDLVRCIALFARGDRGRLGRFTRAYRARWPLRPGFEDRYRIYQLVDCLVLWQYGQKNRVWFAPDLTLRAFAEPLLEDLDPFRALAPAQASSASNCR